MVNNFSKSLRILRKEAGMTQDGLADKVGVSKNMIVRYELGQAVPSFDNLVTLARVLKASYDRLMGNEPTPGTISPDQKQKRIDGVLSLASIVCVQEAIAELGKAEQMQAEAARTVTSARKALALALKKEKIPSDIPPGERNQSR
jgi:transcriptional regulator with XRE-family HTH domain